MLTVAIIAIVLIIFELIAQRKRISAIEDGRGYGYSHSFRVDATEAIMYSDLVKKKSGIKALTEGKDFKDLSKDEKNQFSKIYREIAKKASVRIVYLVSDNVFITTSRSQIPEISRPGSNFIYSAIVYGDEDGFDERIELTIERRILLINKTFESVITAYYQEIPKYDFRNKAKTFILFDYPFVSLNETDDTMKQRGFEIKRTGGDDIFTDALGEVKPIPLMITYTKNRAKIDV